ncbi:tape measure protein [Providencia rettgeri]|uniref:tape measure protein n=2 Tax=Providencia rettgeri TaxID=587 RepID=UPI00141A50B7|nr:tape measure protein [Providencia rettgeri]NIA76655.1 tape measure protein [Providencia rettgeri]
MTINAGNIEIIIKADTDALLVSNKKAEKSLDELDRGFNKTTKSVNTTEKSILSFSKAAIAVSSVLSASTVANYADAWTDLSNKLANSIRQNEKLADVTERVFGISQKTRSSLNGTATLYARLERGTREYNTSAADLIKLTTIINQGFVVSGATAQEAENAIIQLSQGIASGVLRGEEFNSVAEQGSRLMVALADSLGVGIGELRAMAAQGKLTTDVVVNGLLSQGNSIGKEFANTTATMSQSIQTAGNNLTKFFGESTTVQTGISVFNSAIITISENMNVVSGVLISVAAIMGGRFAGAMYLATQNIIKNTAATYANAAAQGKMAAASMAAKSALGLIGGPVGVAVLAASAVFLWSQRAREARESANNLADGIGNLTSKFDQMNRIQMADELKKAREAIPELKESLEEAQKAYDRVSQSVEYNNKVANDYGKTTRKGRKAAEDLAANLEQQKEKAIELEAAQDRLSKTQNAVTLIMAKLNGELLTGERLLTRQSNSALPNAKAAMEAYGLSIDRATKSKQKFNAESLKLDFGGEKGENLRKQLERDLALSRVDGEAKVRLQTQFMAEDAGTTDKQAIQQLQDLAVAKYNNEQARKEGVSADKESAKAADQATDAIKRQREAIERLSKGYEDGSLKLAQFDAVQALGSDASPEQIAKAEQLAEKLFNIEQQLADRRAALEANIIAAAEKARTDELAQIERQLKAGDISFEESQRRRLEIASEYATKIAEATANNIITPVAENRAKFDPVQALQNENTRKLALMREYYNQEQQLLDDSYAKQQMSHEQFTAAKQATDMQYRALITAMDNQYQQQQTAAQWELMRNQSLSYEMLASAVDSFAGNASNVMTGLMTGTMSAADAMRSLGNTILNSVVNSIVQVGVEMLKNFIISKTMGVAAQTANAAAAVAGGAAALAAWTPAAIAASIATGGAAAGSGLASFQSSMLAGQSMSLLGGRRYGGNVSGGNPYRINESGESEIFQTYDGKQAFIPNKSGKVIPADKAGGSNLPPIINVYQQASGATVDVTTEKGLNAQDVINIVVRNIMEGREISGAVSTHHNAPRKATGSL